MSENKTGKPALPVGRYFKYAIGEIILVVIGILIALSINNWNEDRKTENMGKVYIGEIYADIKNEVSNLNDILADLNNQYEKTKNVLSIIESSDKLITDTLQFTDDHWAAPQIFIIQRDLSTFDKLSSSGESGLLKNDSLTTLLDNFYKNFDIRISNFKEYPLQIRMHLREVAFPLGNLSDFLYEQESDKLTATYISEYINNEEVYETLLSVLKTCRYNINFFTETYTEASDLIAYMEREYPELIKQQ